MSARVAIPKSGRLDGRVTPETLAQAADLARRWGPVAPLSQGAVIAEAIRRALLAEQAETTAESPEK